MSNYSGFKNGNYIHYLQIVLDLHGNPRIIKFMGSTIPPTPAGSLVRSSK